MTLLGHRYPRVRRAAAEQFYVKLLENDGAAATRRPECVDRVTQLLLEVAWDGDLNPPDDVRGARNRVSDLLGVVLRRRERNGPETGKSSLPLTDEFESYASLVSFSGR